ncbi:MAG: hypothetical protein NZM94_11695 [Roseiflexus sp.]|nr:hypothetical protein [Roseiflexus sp.]
MHLEHLTRLTAFNGERYQQWTITKLFTNRLCKISGVAIQLDGHINTAQRQSQLFEPLRQFIAGRERFDKIFSEQSLLFDAQFLSNRARTLHNCRLKLVQHIDMFDCHAFRALRLVD